MPQIASGSAAERFDVKERGTTQVQEVRDSLEVYDGAKSRIVIEIEYAHVGGATPAAAKCIAWVFSRFGPMPIGVCAVRTFSGTNTPSQHSYCNAVDFMCSGEKHRQVAFFINANRGPLAIHWLGADPYFPSPLRNHYTHVHADFLPAGSVLISDRMLPRCVNSREHGRHHWRMPTWWTIASSASAMVNRCTALKNRSVGDRVGIAGYAAWNMRREYYAANRERLIAYNAAQNAAHPERRRAYHLKKMYGITPEDYDHLLLEQKGRCGICRADVDLVVDHDHTTGRVRGLLCRRCNRTLGQFEDDRELLRRALEWLED